MNSNNLLVEVREKTLWLSLNRPERLNSLTLEMLSNLRLALVEFKSDPAVSSIVIRGIGPKAFCSGMDLSSSKGDESVFDSPHGLPVLGELFVDMWGYPKPIVAMVHGFALAGGFGLASACDLVICSNDAVFGTPEVNVGLWPYVISVPLLRVLKPRMLLDLMMTGRTINAKQALELDIVNEVVELDELEGAVLDKLNVLNSKSTAVLGHGKQAFYESLDMSSTDSLKYLSDRLQRALLLEDFQEGRKAFAEKRPPEWKNC